MVIWAISGGKRVAYQRVAARHFIYSAIEEERGKLCGKAHNMFLRVSRSQTMNDMQVLEKIFPFIVLFLVAW